MATYYGTYGQKVQYLASDPSDPQTGQVWYNSTSATLKVRAVSTSGTWATGGNMSDGRYGIAGVGIQTAALGFAGYGPAPGTTNSTKTESYNGTSWTTSPATLNRAIYSLNGFGTQTAAIGAGGYFYPGGNQSYAESYNGSAWTIITSLPAARGGHMAAGTASTAGLIFGGSDSGNIATASALNWNGSAWTSAPSLNTARFTGMGAGTQTAAICAGGYQPPVYQSASESYNGTSWTNTPSLNTARAGLGGGGTQTLAYVCGGGDASGPTNWFTATELWNGSTWTTNPTGLNQKRYSIESNVGTQAAGITFGGYNPPSSPLYLVSTEELTGPGAGVTKTVTVS